MAAEELLRKALEKDPQFSEAYYNLGIILERMGRTDESKQAYQNFITYADPNIHAHGSNPPVKNSTAKAQTKRAAFVGGH